MKNIIASGSCKLGGLIFLHPDLPYLNFGDWIKQGCPKDKYILADPDLLLLCNIPVCDAVLYNGVYIKSEVGPMVKTDFRVFSYLKPKEPKSVKETHIIKGIKYTDPRQKGNNKHPRSKK